MKLYKYLFTLLFSGASLNLAGQNPDWIWANSLHTGADELSHDVVADPVTIDVLSPRYF